MRPAFDGVDVIDEAETFFSIAVVILERDLDDDTVFLSFEKNRLWVKGRASPAQVLDEGNNSALEFEVLALVDPLINDGELQSLVQVGQLP